MEVMSEYEATMLQVYAECNMRVGRAANRLYVHHNTLRYHFEKIRKETGLNPQMFKDLVELLSRIERGEAEE